MMNTLLTLNEALASIIFKIIKVQKGICFLGYGFGKKKLWYMYRWLERGTWLSSYLEWALELL
jgi:hypothetical protein